MAKYVRWDPSNKKAGRKKNRSKLGLLSKTSKVIRKENEIQTPKLKIGLR